MLTTKEPNQLITNNQSFGSLFALRGTKRKEQNFQIATIKFLIMRIVFIQMSD